MEYVPILIFGMIPFISDSSVQSETIRFNYTIDASIIICGMYIIKRGY
jgi:hypothetical protein